MKEFSEVYASIFQAAKFGKMVIPVLNFKHTEKNIDRFVIGVIEDSIRNYIAKNYRWNVNYFFLSEEFSDLRDLGLAGCEWVKFDKKGNTVWVDEEILFTIMMIIKRRIEKEGLLKDSGFTNWFKREDYGGFQKDLRIILSRSDLREGIMRGRPLESRFFLSRKEVFEFLGGSLKGKVKEVIEICKERSPGSWSKKTFKSEKSVDNAAQMLYDQIKSSSFSRYGDERIIKKRRITRRACLKYVLYLGLMGTIQTRVGEPVSLSSRMENEFFTFYKEYRDAAIRLGWLEIADETFCPGIRCKSFIVKIMCKPVKVEKTLVMNKIEEKFYMLDDQGRRDLAFFYGPHAYDFLLEKAQIRDREKKIAGYGVQIKRLAFMIFQNDRNGPWYQQAREKKWKLSMEKTWFPHEVAAFKKKWSDPTTFKWFLNPLELAA